MNQMSLSYEKNLLCYKIINNILIFDKLNEINLKTILDDNMMIKIIKNYGIEPLFRQCNKEVVYKFLEFFTRCNFIISAYKQTSYSSTFSLNTELIDKLISNCEFSCIPNLIIFIKYLKLDTFQTRKINNLIQLHKANYMLNTLLNYKNCDINDIKLIIQDSKLLFLKYNDRYGDYFTYDRMVACNNYDEAKNIIKLLRENKICNGKININLLLKRSNLNLNNWQYYNLIRYLIEEENLDYSEFRPLEISNYLIRNYIKKILNNTKTKRLLIPFNNSEFNCELDGEINYPLKNLFSCLGSDTEEKTMVYLKNNLVDKQIELFLNGLGMKDNHIFDCGNYYLHQLFVNYDMKHFVEKYIELYKPSLERLKKVKLTDNESSLLIKYEIERAELKELRTKLHAELQKKLQESILTDKSKKYVFSDLDKKLIEYISKDEFIEFFKIMKKNNLSENYKLGDKSVMELIKDNNANECCKILQCL